MTTPTPADLLPCPKCAASKFTCDEHYVPPFRQFQRPNQATTVDEKLAAAVDALESMIEIAEAWEAVDGRQNIQLDNSRAFQSAIATLAAIKGSQPA